MKHSPGDCHTCVRLFNKRFTFPNQARAEPAAAAEHAAASLADYDR